MKYDKIALESLRGLSLDMITKANSGHPGMCLSAAPLLYTLFTRHLNADPSDPKWINRDRFVLSAGHGSALLYALLHLASYPISMDALKEFRQLNSITPGHPEFGKTPGIDATSGPLGQGLAQAVGMAMAEAHLPTIYPEGEKLINHFTYVLTGDGCLEEGVSHEAIAYAGLQKLNKLILLYDRNDCTLDGPLTDSDTSDVKARFEAFNWNVLEVMDGNNLEEIDNAITLAKTAKEKPTIIICHTVIGYGSPLAGTNASHGKAFTKEDVVKTKETLGVSFLPFDVPEEAYLAFKETFVARSIKVKEEYNNQIAQYKEKYQKEYDTFLSLIDNDVAKYIFKSAPHYEDGFKDATRNSSQSFLNLVADELPNLFGGSADVASSVKTQVKKFTTFTPENRSGSNINFGIREFGMASIQNGILLHGGLRTYVGSFFVFSDYMKPAMRMAAMEKLPAIYLFSHDTISVGEDGPTHEPIEQLTMIRSIPNFSVIRPCDAIEVAASYNLAFSSIDKPTALILTRQALPNIPTSSFDGCKKGGYVISKENNEASYILLASGSEVSLAIEIQQALLVEGIDVRVVSMPSLDIFDEQTDFYKDEVLHLPYEKRIFIEMDRSDVLYKYAKYVLGIDTFGKSAPFKDLLEYYGFTADKLKEKILKIIK